METHVKTGEEFEAAVKDGKALVDFWATWCGPCQMMGQVLADEFGPAHPEVKIVKVNVDEAPELAARFGVMSIPTLLCFRDGAKVAEFVGVTSPSEIASSFN